MKKDKIAVIALLALLAAMPVQALADEDAAAPAEPAAAAEAQPATADGAMEQQAALPGDTVVATVNGEKIDMYLLDKVMEQVPSVPGGVNVKNEVLDKLIDLELIAQAARKDGMDKDPAFRVGLEMYERQQLFAVYLNRAIVEKVSVAPEDVQKYYDEHKSEFESGEQVRASHILVDTEEKAAEIKKKLDEGANFEELAKAESSCPSKARGGDLGFFDKKTMVPEFADAAFALKQDEVSSPVKTQFGWHVIKLTGRKDAGAKAFDEVKGDIEQKLLGDKQQEAYDALVAQLRKDASITVNMDALGAAN